jgi:hypothetical protein
MKKSSSKANSGAKKTSVTKNALRNLDAKRISKDVRGGQQPSTRGAYSSPAISRCSS